MSKLFSSAFSTVGKAVKTVASTMLDWNTSTFSGAVDIIVVCRKEGNGYRYHCTPFHVRFGILQVMKTSDQVVTIEVNGEVVDLKMKLSKNGFAYFASEEDWDVDSHESFSSLEDTEEESESSILSGKSTSENRSSTKSTPLRCKSWPHIEAKTHNKSALASPKPSLHPKVRDYLLLNQIRISLCLHIIKQKSDDPEAVQNSPLPYNKHSEEFEKNLIALEDVLENPNIIFDQNLAVLHQEKIFPGKIFVPYVISKIAFGHSLCVEDFGVSTEPKIKEDTPSQRDKKPKKQSKQTKAFQRMNYKTKPSTGSEPLSGESQDNARDDKFSFHRKRSLRPSSEELEALELNKGTNIVRFTVNSSLQGTQIIEAGIYLYDEDTRIVVTDIDGTITKSDMLGFILPNFGNSWAHRDVAKLFRRIRENGYIVIYMTARLISLTSLTRNYLFGLDQNGGEQLPVGPILTFPVGMMTAYRAEKWTKPHDTKIQILRQVEKLYNGREVFYAGFGNQTSDSITYEAVGIPLARSFIINQTGEIIKHNAKFSYGSISESVDTIFPVINQKHKSCDVKFGLNYWKIDEDREETSFGAIEGIDT